MVARTILSWEALEFNAQSLPRSFYMWSGGFLVLTILYALFTNSPIMAITFILIGIMGFITLEKEPQTVHCSITEEGVVVERELYAFENILSFSIDTETPFHLLSLKTNGKLTALVSLPLGECPPQEVRTQLLAFVPEEAHEPNLIDTLAKMLHSR